MKGLLLFSRMYYVIIRLFPAVCLCVGTAVYAQDINSGLKCWLPFGFNNAQDYSTNMITTTPNIGSYQSNVPTNWQTNFPTAAYFNGTSSYVSLNLLDPNMDKYWTFSFWFQPMGFTNSTNSVDSTRVIFMQNGKPLVHFIGHNFTWGDMGTPVSYPLPIVNDQYMHLAVVHNYSNAEGSLYMNGTLAHTWTNAEFNALSGGGASIGRDDSGNTNYFKGLLKDFRFYTRLLSGADINALYMYNRVPPIPPDFSVLVTSTFSNIGIYINQVMATTEYGKVWYQATNQLAYASPLNAFSKVVSGNKISHPSILGDVYIATFSGGSAGGTNCSSYGVLYPMSITNIEHVPTAEPVRRVPVLLHEDGLNNIVSSSRISAVNVYQPYPIVEFSSYTNWGASAFPITNGTPYTVTPPQGLFNILFYIANWQNYTNTLNGIPSLVLRYKLDGKLKESRIQISEYGYPQIINANNMDWEYWYDIKPAVTFNWILRDQNEVAITNAAVSVMSYGESGPTNIAFIQTASNIYRMVFDANLTRDAHYININVPGKAPLGFPMSEIEGEIFSADLKTNNQYFDSLYGVWRNGVSITNNRSRKIDVINGGTVRIHVYDQNGAYITPVNPAEDGVMIEAEDVDYSASALLTSGNPAVFHNLNPRAMYMLFVSVSN